MAKADFREWIKADFREWSKADSIYAARFLTFVTPYQYKNSVYMKPKSYFNDLLVSWTMAFIVR